MTHEEWIETGEEEMKQKAKEIAKWITFRNWTDGSSKDETVEANELEADTTYGIVMAAMLAYGRRKDADLQSVLDTAEFAGHFLYGYDEFGDKKEVNCYDTIYIPLQKTMGEWS